MAATTHTRAVHAFCVITMLGCGSGPRTSDDADLFDSPRVETEVRAMLEAYGDAMRHDGLLGEFPFLDTSDAFFWVPPGYAGPIGIDSVHAVLRRNAPGLRHIDPRWNELRIEPLGERHALYTGSLRLESISMKGDTSIIRLLETGLVVKRPDGWKLLGGQSALAP